MRRNEIKAVSIALTMLALIPLMTMALPASAAGTTTAPKTPWGYYYIGKWKISDVCYVHTGICIGFQGLVYASLIPSGGSSAIASAVCWGSDVVCWGADTAARFFGCKGFIYVYGAYWWNFWGPKVYIIPSCV